MTQIRKNKAESGSWLVKELIAAGRREFAKRVEDYISRTHSEASTSREACRHFEKVAFDSSRPKNAMPPWLAGRDWVYKDPETASVKPGREICKLLGYPLSERGKRRRTRDGKEL